MSEPKRLLEDAEGLERRVLESARADDPAPLRRRRVMAAVATAATTTVAGSASAATGIAAWKIAAGLAAFSTLAIVAVQRPSTPVVTETSNTPVIEKKALPLPEWKPPAGPSSAPNVVAPEPPKLAVPVAKAPVAIPSSSIVVEEGPPLAREVALLDEARAALDAKNPRGALAALDRYDIECKGGALGKEALVLRNRARAQLADANP